uniref:histone H1-like n=1 Tax=Styela clava TaxID=7725 RepID=UPI00193ABAC2|nr:histone H1-like [Styela clava]
MELDAPMPSGARKAKKRAAKKRKRRNTPKYRDMIVKAIKALKEPKGCTPQAIAKYIEHRYKKRNDFVIKHVINWLVQKRVLSKYKGRVKITGKKLKLGKRGRVGQKKSKGKGKRRRR